MRTRRAKRSEPFWPSIVMRKWLNIKPLVHEFSEDEVETESEDDDAKSIGPEDWFCSTVGFRSVNPTQASDHLDKQATNMPRRQRRKSETLRVQYINKKDLRIMIGTWNVAGRIPSDDLIIDDWLCTEEPADMYIFGRIFWFGDLNYRINLSDQEIRELVARKRWDELMKSDQLCKELQCGCVFDGWREGSINFPPTYKYEVNSTRYFGEAAREGEKKRSPAWCDRILWLGKEIRQLCYERSELDLSDHRPVRAVFVVEVEVFDQRKLQRVLDISNAGLPYRFDL